MLFVEDSEDYPACYNPQSLSMTRDPSYGLAFTAAIFEKYDLSNQWAYFDSHTNTWHGSSEPEIRQFLNEADLLLNLSGVNPIRSWMEKIPVRAFVDTDPVFTQVRNLTDPAANQRTAFHNVHFTFGENYGKSECTIPQDGYSWKPTRQPVVTSLWNRKKGDSNRNWNTVMQWDSYKTAVWNGNTYDMKSKSFKPYQNLPSQFSEKFELALGSDTAPKKALLDMGWKIRDPFEVTRTPNSFRQFIQESKGEWSIAKHGYVITRSGWFSERSTSYLASGRPVVVQETGFSENIQTGAGLFAFENPEELAHIFSTINDSYDKQCDKAWETCHEYFESTIILKKLINSI